MSNFGSDGFIIVGSLENEQSFAGNEVLLKSIFKGAFFSGKNRKLIFENMYLYGLPAELPETGVWGEITK